MRPAVKMGMVAERAGACVSAGVDVDVAGKVDGEELLVLRKEEEAVAERKVAAC